MTDLGAMVIDQITGVVGIAYERLEKIGQTQIGIQPRQEGASTLAEMNAFDENYVTKLPSDHSLYVAPFVAHPPPEHGFKPGDWVEHKVNGKRGVIQIITTFLNGCVFLSVVLEEFNDEQISIYDDHHYWKLIPRKKNLLEGETVKTGGPITKGMRP